MTWQMRGALVAGDVLTTATAGAGETARIRETADPAQRGGRARGETDQVTAAGPESGVPENLPASPTTAPSAPTAGGGAPDGRAAEDKAPAAGTTASGAAPARQNRQTRQEPASVAQPVPPGAGVRRRLARLGAQR